MKKSKKIAIGLGVFIGLGIVGSFIPSEEATPIESNTSIEEKKVSTLSNEELISKLETYEAMYSNHIEGLNKVAQEGNAIEMQKLFAQSRDISSATFSILYDLSKGYEKESNEYHAIEELQAVFMSLEEACKDGIKYLDSKQYKHLERYEGSLNQAELFMDRYKEYKEMIKRS